MVFLTLANLIRVKRIPHLDHSWHYRWVFKLTQHFYGRRRNCYRIAIRGALRALHHSTRHNTFKAAQMQRLWETRINAGCNEHGTNKDVLLEGLARANIILDRKMLADLAIREPRTFKCIADVAAAKFAIDPPQKASLKVLDPPPPGVITRGML